MRWSGAALFCLLGTPALAGTVESDLCRRDLFQTRGALITTQSNLAKVAAAPRPERCTAYRKHVEVMKKAASVHAACLTDPERKDSVADDLSSAREFEDLIKRECRGL
jgi:hypothetical protein